MSHYKHLTIVEREKLDHLRAEGKSIASIAESLGRSKSTISRELRRNASEGEYIPCKAQARYQKRREACRPAKRLADPALMAFVCDKLFNHQWSPEQIAGRLRRERGKCVVSCATIYRAIWCGMLDEAAREAGPCEGKAKRKLRHRGKKRHRKGAEERRGKIRISNELENRPEDANARSRIGDWEADTVAGIQGGACIVTLNDRKSRYLIARVVPSKSAVPVAEAIIEALRGQPAYTITPDRGKEFALHSKVTEALGVPFYFPKPHQPWQRGTNENSNGLLREYYPKGSSFYAVTNEELQVVVDRLNDRPRKCLGWKTPREVYFNTVLHLT